MVFTLFLFGCSEDSLVSRLQGIEHNKLLFRVTVEQFISLILFHQSRAFLLLIEYFGSNCLFLVHGVFVFAFPVLLFTYNLPWGFDQLVRVDLQLLVVRWLRYESLVLFNF